VNRTLHGAIIGAAAGVGVGILGELLTVLVRSIYPTDVIIVGFAMFWAVPLGLLVGAVSWWRGWLTNPSRLAFTAAIPGLLAGILAALLQWSVR
jgi:hypothetical protein